MSTLSEENVDAFLKDLAKLTVRHGISIVSCGCGSCPILDTPSEWELDGHYVIDDIQSKLHWEPNR